MMLFIRSLLFNTFCFATVIVAAVLLIVTFWLPYRYHWAICLNWCRTHAPRVQHPKTNGSP